MKDFEKQLIERNKDMWFVQHIEAHIKEMQLKGNVCCKICNKDIDQIAEERYDEIKIEIKKAVG